MADDTAKSSKAESDAILKEARERWDRAYEKEKSNIIAAYEDLEFLVGGDSQWDEASLKERREEGRPCLTVNQIPAHSHPLLATVNPGATTNPQGNLTASSPNVGLYIEDVTGVNLSAAAITSVGGSQPHTNFQPYLCINYIISLFGIFPSPT